MSLGWGLYRNENGEFTIEDNDKYDDYCGEENYSLHALGHLSNPFNKEIKHWHKQIWLDILRLHYKDISEDEFLNKYRNRYGISQFTISTYNLWKRFAILNRGKNYNDMIKPGNFMLIGFGNNSEIKPIAPSCSEPQAMPYSPFINYKTGEVMEGLQYFQSLADILYNYIRHPESKLEGSVGRLDRKHIVVDKITYIGKEANRIDDNISGLDKMRVNSYNNTASFEKIILTKNWSDIKQCGIPESQFYAMRKQLQAGKRLKLSSKTKTRLKSLGE